MSFNGLKEEERCAAMEFVDKNDNLLKKSDSTIVFHFWYFGNGVFFNVAVRRVAHTKTMA